MHLCRLPKYLNDRIGEDFEGYSRGILLPNSKKKALEIEIKVFYLKYLPALSRKLLVLNDHLSAVSPH